MGRYVQDGQVVRTITVPYDGSATRSFGLVEDYAADFAATMKDNDTSFMVHGELDGDQASVSFPFKSKETQFVTVTVVPVNQLDYFTLTVKNASGKVIAISDSHDNVNWIQVAVPAGTKLTAEVTLDSGGFHPGITNQYRLSVVGSTKHINASNIVGPHQVDY